MMLHQPLSAGPPLFCTRVRIVDPSEDSEAFEIAQEGEILVAGPTVAPGSLAGDGWLHTGDLGALDEHGRLRVTGRKADTIVSGGENVAPAEVEAVLEAHPDVLEAAVLGRADERWGEAVTAIVVTRPGAVLEVRRCAPTAPVASPPIRCPSRCRSPTSRCRALARASSCAKSSSDGDER